MSDLSSLLLIAARRRAGLSQRQLAVKAGVAQPWIARLERGHATPSVETLRGLIAACGLDLTPWLTEADTSYNHQIRCNLNLPLATRMARALQTGCANRVQTGLASPASSPPDLEVALRVAASCDARFVLVGEFAAAALGSPIAPSTGTVLLVPHPDDEQDLAAHVHAAGPLALPIELELRPPGTFGFADLSRDAQGLELLPGVHVRTASLIDLIRIADTTLAPDAAALRRIHELVSADSRAERAA